MCAELSKQTPMGMQAFGPLRAESEQPWLDDCLVLPNDFDLLAMNRSIIIFGETGSGKTAMYQALKLSGYTMEGVPKRLTVEWHLTEPQITEEPNIARVTQQVYQIFDLCAESLAKYLVEAPHLYQDAPEWAQVRVGWFIHTFLAGDAKVRLAPLIYSPTGNGLLLQALLESQPIPILHKDASPEQVLVELGIMLKAMGLEGVWVLVDNIERLAELDEQNLLNKLMDILATLSIFERSDFALKLFVPSRLEQSISSASGLNRSRIVAYKLKWGTPDLHRIVESRLNLAMGREDFTLEMLCNAPKLLSWLEGVGVQSPRMWLDQVQHLLKDYLQNERIAPIDNKAWRGLNKLNPPPLYIDRIERSVIIGGRFIPPGDITPQTFDLLLYLYDNSNRVVSKAEIFYRVFQKMTFTPRTPDDAGYQNPSEYEGMVDTCIWRLRRTIEPDSKNPVLIVTQRSRGIRLAVRW